MGGKERDSGHVGLSYISHIGTHLQNAVSLSTLDKPEAKARPAVAGRVKTSVSTSGRVLQLSANGFEQIGGGLRGEVSGNWSNQSRTRLVKTAEAIDWGALGTLLFVTLTYRHMPESGRDSKRHLKNFRERWRRGFGDPGGMWKLEFQRRGVPHYHLILKAPEPSLGEMRKWVSESWFEVVGTGEKEHLQAGTECDYWRASYSPGAYFAKYGLARGKEYQNRAPEGFWTGHWWGTWGGIKPQWTEMELTHDEFWRLRRIARRLRRSRGGSKANKSRRSMQGLWIAGNDLQRAIDFVKVG